jgi:hypothetical protein
VVWEHVDAEETMPEWDGSIVPFFCPNCGTHFEVDLS